jgi:molecular chaperone DnaJ
MHDPFVVLGLDRSASPTEIKRAYRTLAMRWHPDRNPTREAEERFKVVKAAYELLLDPQRLAAWEACRSEGAAHGVADSDGMDDAPDADRPDSDTDDAEGSRLTLQLDLEEAALGCTRSIRLASKRVCSDCDGSGRHQHAHSMACPECKGVGRVRRAKNPCEACGGQGYVRETPCIGCLGQGWQGSTRQLDVRVPPGMLPGERLRLAKQHRPREGDAGNDLLVAIAIRPHPLFELDGCDLECTVPVGIFRLLHGGAIDIPVLNGTRLLEIASYPAHGLDYAFAGLGYPGRHGRNAGQLRVRLVPVYPRELDEAARKLLLRLDRAMLADAARAAPELHAWHQTLQARTEA